MQGGAHTKRAPRTLFFRPTPAPAAKLAKGRRAPAPPGRRLRGRRLTSSVVMEPDDGVGNGRRPGNMPMARRQGVLHERLGAPLDSSRTIAGRVAISIAHLQSGEGMQASAGALGPGCLRPGAEHWDPAGRRCSGH